MTEHTKQPPVTLHVEQDPYSKRFAICCGPQDAVAALQAHHNDEDIAKRLVHTWNCHDELLVALIAVKNECAEINTAGDVYIPVDTLKSVLKAIDKAEPADPNIIEGVEGDLMTIAMFNEECEDGCFLDSDGHGYAVYRGKFAKSSDGSRIRVYPSQRIDQVPSHVTHVLWCNK